MILGLKPMGKLITCDNYLGVRTKPKSCMVLRLKLMGKLTTCDNYLGTRQNQNLFPLSIKYSHSSAWVLGPNN